MMLGAERVEALSLTRAQVLVNLRRTALGAPVAAVGSAGVVGG